MKEWQSIIYADRYKLDESSVSVSSLNRAAAGYISVKMNKSSMNDISLNRTAADSLYILRGKKNYFILAYTHHISIVKLANACYKTVFLFLSFKNPDISAILVFSAIVVYI